MERSRYRHSLGSNADDRLKALLAGAPGSPALWSDAEAQIFEEGLRTEGKNFTAIAALPGLEG